MFILKFLSYKSYNSYTVIDYILKSLDLCTILGLIQGSTISTNSVDNGFT